MMRLLGDLTSVSIGAFSCLLKLFQVAGFVNFPLHVHQTAGIEIGKKHWRSCIWWALHCLYATVCVVMARYDYSCLYAGLELTGTMNNYFRFVIGMATAFVTLGDTFCSVDRHRAIWKCYQRLAERCDGAYLGQLDRTRAGTFMRWVVEIFFLLVAISAGAQYKAFFTLRPGTQWQCVWVYNMYPVMVSYMRHLFHLLYIGLMGENLRQLVGKLNLLRQTVDELLEETNVSLNPRKHEAAVLSSLENLEECRSIYTELWQANESINELFGFSQMFNVACSFVQIGFDLYWVRYMILMGEPHLDLQLLFFFPTPIIVGFLLHTTSNYHLVVVSLRQAVLDMPCMHDTRLVQLRGHFLGQLQRLRFRLTARNVFEFDNTLLPKLVFVIVTYMIIFVEINR